MRATVVTTPGDPQAERATRALRQLALQIPTLQAAVALVGRFSTAQLRAQIARVEPPLLATVALPETVEGSDLPLLRIDDLRNHRSIGVDARNLTRDSLAQLILALRRNSAAASLPGPAPQGRATTP